MNRRDVLLLAAAPHAGPLTACTGRPSEAEAPSDAEQILAAAALAAPETEASVEDGVLQGDEAWSKVVTFSGSAEQIEAWVEASFPGGIESTAYKDDLAVVVERLGEGVQKKGDRLAEGVEGSTAFVVVVGQEDEPVVHTAVRHTGR